MNILIAKKIEFNSKFDENSFDENLDERMKILTKVLFDENFDERIRALHRAFNHVE